MENIELTIKFNAADNTFDIKTDRPSNPMEMIDIFANLILTARSMIKAVPAQKVVVPDKPRIVGVGK